MTFIGAIDQGTSSTRFLVFDTARGTVVAQHQTEFPQHYPQPGWHEHDPEDIFRSVVTCLEEVVYALHKQGVDRKRVRAIGITNQRETTVCWDAQTGRPLHNAIVWDDARTAALVDQLAEQHPSKSRTCVQAQCGLPLATYFSALKMRWMLDNIPAVRAADEAGTLRFGTVDSWLIYKLTGGVDGGRHVTDVTNASRTMLVDLSKPHRFAPDLLDFFHISQGTLPRILSSSEIYGHIHVGLEFAGVPIAGCLGDQQAALVGQRCFRAGDAKNTYGTGCFMLYNTGTRPVWSRHGLLTTIAYQLGPGTSVTYALEGSVAVAGSAVQWLRDGLGLISDAAEASALAQTVPDTGGVYFVTALNGLFAPYWREDARGTVVGLTRYTQRAHLARATLEATCFQTLDIINVMNQDSQSNGHYATGLQSLRVDGGMTQSDLTMQTQADLLGIPVERPEMRETTALGAAIAAGLAVGVWDSMASVRANLDGATTYTVFEPNLSAHERSVRHREWKRAVQRSLGWVVPESEAKAEAAALEEEELQLKGMRAGQYGHHGHGWWTQAALSMLLGATGVVAMYVARGWLK